MNPATSSKLAELLLAIEEYDLGLDYYQRFADLVQRVTAQDILETARRYLDPDHLAISVAGPEK